MANSLLEVKHEKIYDICELKEIDSKIYKNLQYLKRTKRSISIAEFFKRNKNLEAKLRATQIFGIPANAFFSSYNLCVNKCDQVSRLFAVCSNIPGIVVATALNKSIAKQNYKMYKMSWRTAHHTWVEFCFDGKDIVIDFTDQRVFNKDDYYRIHYLYKEDVSKKPVSKICGQQFIIDSLFSAAAKIAEMSNYNMYLCASLDELINSQFRCEFNDTDSKIYFEKEISNIKNKFVEYGLNKKVLSPAQCVDYYVYSLFENKPDKLKTLFFKDITEIAKMFYKKYANEESIYKYMPTTKDCAILKKMYPETKNLLKLVNHTYYGPLEDIDSTYIEIYNEKF